MNKPVNEVTNQQNGGQKAMPIELARVTLWPVRPYKGQPMGTLLDNKQLSLKDLGYAIENAWDERVRQAAIALMLVRVDQTIKDPTPFVGPLRVISGGRSFVLRRQFFLTFIQGSVGGGALGLTIALFIVQISRPVSTNSSKPLSDLLSSPLGILSLIIALGLGLVAIWLPPFLLDQILKPLDKRIENYRKGQE